MGMTVTVDSSRIPQRDNHSRLLIKYLRYRSCHRYNSPARFHGATWIERSSFRPIPGISGTERRSVEFPLVLTLGVVFGRAAPKKRPFRTRRHKTLRANTRTVGHDARKPTLGGKKKRVAHNGSGATPPASSIRPSATPLLYWRWCTRVPLGISEIYIPVRPIVGRRMAGIS